MDAERTAPPSASNASAPAMRPSDWPARAAEVPPPRPARRAGRLGHRNGILDMPREDYTQARLLQYRRARRRNVGRPREAYLLRARSTTLALHYDFRLRPTGRASELGLPRATLDTRPETPLVRMFEGHPLGYAPSMDHPQGTVTGAVRSRSGTTAPTTTCSRRVSTPTVTEGIRKGRLELSCTARSSGGAVSP